jgi:hypothetical protein
VHDRPTDYVSFDPGTATPGTAINQGTPLPNGVDGYLVARRYDPERSRAREQTAATAQTPLGSRE